MARDVTDGWLVAAGDVCRKGTRAAEFPNLDCVVDVRRRPRGVGVFRAGL